RPRSSGASGSSAVDIATLHPGAPGCGGNNRCGANRCTNDSEPIVTRAQRHLVAIFLVIGSLLGAAGCVSVPMSGPIDKVEGQQPPCQNCVNVEVAPPASGDEPRQIVEGYLRATSNYQPNYSVAKQFLTRMAAEKWSAEQDVSIYRGSVIATGQTTVSLSGKVVGRLGRDRTYAARDQDLSID